MPNKHNFSKEMGVFMLNKHNIKKAFTLAEILITLSIIGIVAAMTIPALNNNVTDKQFKEAFKKVYAELSLATQNIMYNNGGTMRDLCTDVDANGTCDSQANGSLDVITLYKSYIKYGKECTWAANQNCWSAGGSRHYLSGEVDNTVDNAYGLVLLSGATLLVGYRWSNCGFTQFGAQMTYCGWISVDTNGPAKKPNKWGKDLFEISIVERGLVPRGAGTTDSSEYLCETSTDHDNFGWGCAEKVIRNIDY